MAELKVNELATTLRTVEAQDRMYLTADRERLVAEDDPEAASLFASPGTEITRADAIRYGLVKEAPEEKQARQAEEKATDKAAELAAEENVDLADVEGSGKDGAITKADVAEAAKEEAPAEEPKQQQKKPQASRKSATRKSGSRKRT
jgi:pyruvate/2-oxoglutarate dehydrogenase complex dihydrolipoamide acyltransferase (E2) component